MSTRHLLRYAALLGGYVAAGKFGLSLALVHASASAVWPPSGIAIAGLLLWGRRFWPSVFLGAFIVNVTTSGEIFSALGIATGNTLEAVVATLLVNRFAGGVAAFDRVRDLFKYLGVAAVASPAISASIGVLSLAAVDADVWNRRGAIWLTWWIGDAIAVTVLTPAIVLWARQTADEWRAGRWFEAAAVAAIVVVSAFAVFGNWFPWPTDLPITFLCMPSIMWAAMRFGPRGGATATLVAAAVAVWGTLHGLGPFSRSVAVYALPLLQAFIGVGGVTALVMGALNSERRAAERRSHSLQDALADRVRARTVELQEANRLLAAEIQDRDRATQALELSEARLLEAQHVAHIGSWEWNIVGDQVWWSTELFRIYGLDEARFTASFAGFLDRVHPDDRSRVEDEVRSIVETLGQMSFEHRVVRPDGDVRWLLARGRVITDATGQPVRMVGTGHDITEWKALQAHQAALAGEFAARQQAEDANRQKDEFLAVLSHELRTPLNAIVGWLQLLRMRTLDAETARAIEVIDRNSEALRRIVEDLLDLSAISSGKLRLNVQPLDLRPALQAAIDSIRPKATSRNIAVELSDGESLEITGDGQRLQQVVANLLTNALKFTPPGGRVTVSGHRDGEGIVVKVTDSGIGVPPEVLPFVFDAFHQADSTLSRGQGGLGLGLAITRHLVELHDGTISVESPGENQGATFTVRLPAGVEPVASALTHEVPAIAGVLDRARILVVDDDADARAILEIGLRAAGADVVSSESADDGDRRRREFVPDAIVVDIQMPGRNGYDFVRGLRSAGDRTPAIAVTAHASADDQQRALDAGFDRHLTKPVHLPELVDAIGGLLTSRVVAAGAGSRGNQRPSSGSRA